MVYGFHGPVEGQYVNSKRVNGSAVEIHTLLALHGWISPWYRNLVVKIFLHNYFH